MNGAQSKKTEWTSPSVLLAVFGIAMAGFGSYESFQRDSGAAVAELRARIDNLEHRLDRMEDRKP